MPVKIRLKRMGAKKRPFYRIVVADSKAPRDGVYIEELGFYNPIPDPAEVRIDEERAIFWLSKGAIPTETARSLLKRYGVLSKWDQIRRATPTAEPVSVEPELAAPEPTEPEVGEAETTSPEPAEHVPPAETPTEREEQTPTEPVQPAPSDAEGRDEAAEEPEPPVPETQGDTVAETRPKKQRRARQQKQKPQAEDATGN